LGAFRFLSQTNLKTGPEELKPAAQKNGGRLKNQPPVKYCNLKDRTLIKDEIKLIFLFFKNIFFNYITIF
jgi:hypothetical protein